MVHSFNERMNHLLCISSCFLFLPEPLSYHRQLAEREVMLYGVCHKDTHQQGVESQAQEDVPRCGNEGGGKIEDDGQ